jgi:hypothetical protein
MPTATYQAGPDLQAHLNDADPVEVMQELRPWLRDVLGGLASLPSSVRDSLLAGLPLGAREELASYRIITDSAAHADPTRELLTPLGRGVSRACHDHAQDHGDSQAYRDKVAEAEQWAEEASARRGTAGAKAPHERRRAARKR